MILIGRKWRMPRVFVGMMVFELLDIIALLTLFGIASPDTYRTAMWQVGSDNGFNSSPNQILYAYANYRPLPVTPLIWSTFITNFNVICSIFTMFLLLAKCVAFVLHIWRPLIGLIANVILLGLWTLSAYGQAGPDNSDPKHPSPSAWYLRYSCSYAESSGQKGHCIQAKASFATTSIMLCIVFFNLCHSIWSVIPTKEEKTERRERDEDRRALEESPSTEKAWELGNYPRTPLSATQPFTPRTTALHTLERQLPLRDYSK